jgi:hypothetical protein
MVIAEGSVSRPASVWVPIEVGLVCGKDLAQVAFVHDEDPVE